MTSDRTQRPNGWDLALAAEIAAASGRPWAWGEHDCATFAARCATAMVGRHAFSDTLGRHSTALGARRVIGRAGAADLSELLDLRLRRIPLRAAIRGDVVALSLDQAGEPDPQGEPALGVVEGQLAAFAAFPAGLRRWPVLDCFAAWPVDPAPERG